MPYKINSPAIPFRVLRLPAPGIGAHCIEGEFFLPAEKGFRLFDFGVGSGDVALAARGDFIRDFLPRCFGEGGDDFLDRMPALGAEINRSTP